MFLERARQGGCRLRRAIHTALPRAGGRPRGQDAGSGLGAVATGTASARSSRARRSPTASPPKRIGYMRSWWRRGCSRQGSRRLAPADSAGRSVVVCMWLLGYSSVWPATAVAPRQTGGATRRRDGPDAFGASAIRPPSPARTRVSFLTKEMQHITGPGCHTHGQPAPDVNAAGSHRPASTRRQRISGVA